MESQQEYVFRKLNANQFNLAEAARSTDIKRDTIRKIKDGVTKNPGTRTVQALYDYFKSLAD